MEHIISYLREETNQKVTQAYLALHTKPYSKDGIQKLEEGLSHDIYDAEAQIQKYREQSPDIVEEYYRRRTILKRIADGLAWLILDFNSSQIRACSMGHSPGFMAGKQGYKAERNLVEGCAKHPNIKWAIQCDITNILRLGDVIAVTTNGETHPFEVKGSKSGQATRQRKRANKVLDFIKNGVFRDYIKGLGPLHSIQVPVTYNYYWKELESLSIKALEEGIAWEIFDESLAIITIETSRSNEEFIDKTIRDITVNWNEPNLIYRGLGRHMSRDPEILPRTRLPLTLFPIDTSLGIRFILRELDAIILLDLNSSIRKIKEVGIDISKDDNGVPTINLESGMKFSILDGWEKILLELITLPSFIEYIKLSTQKIGDKVQDVI